MPLARCPKCGATFPNILRECPDCGYSPFTIPNHPQQPPQRPPQMPQPQPPQPPQQRLPQQQQPQQPLPQRPQQPPQRPPQPVPAATVDSGTDDEEKSGSLLRRLLPIIAVVLGLALIAGGFFWMRSRSKNPAPPPDSAPVYCADGEHDWAEATCTEPRTCTVCGKTEGEALGHEFEGNLCTRCGAYEKPFVFSGLSCRRSGDELAFSGAIRNYTPLNAKKIQLRLELFDENENLLRSDEVLIFEQDVVPAQDSAKWRFTYDDAGLRWKYWRVSVINYIIEVY